MDSLVSTEWLAHEMGASDLRIVDASYHLPDAARDARADYEAGHIPGAVFLNLAELVDPASPVDNTLPSAEKFASRMQELGLGDGSRIVLYDDSAIRTSARAWYMLRVNPVALMIWWLVWLIPLWIGFRMFLKDEGLVWERTEKIDANHTLVRSAPDRQKPLRPKPKAVPAGAIPLTPKAHARPAKGTASNA